MSVAPLEPLDAAGGPVAEDDGPVRGVDTGLYRRTKRRFDPNVQRKRYWLPSEGRRIRLTLSTNHLRTFGLSRIRLREMAHAGELPGVTKSSW